jgi:hypothetical protein
MKSKEVQTHILKILHLRTLEARGRFRKATTEATVHLELKSVD